METWIDNVLPNVDEKRTKIVDASEGIEPLGSSGHGRTILIRGEPVRFKQQARHLRCPT